MLVRGASVAGVMILLGAGYLDAGGEDELQKAGEETLAVLRRSINELRELDRERRVNPEAELRILQEELVNRTER